MKKSPADGARTIIRTTGTVPIALRRVASDLLRYYPFTASGTVLFVFSVYLFIAGVAGRNPYALLLSFASFLFLAVLAVLGRFQAAKLSGSEPSWDPGGPVYAERTGIAQNFSFPGVKILPFFRMNVLLRGPLVAGRKLAFNFRREVSVIQGSSVEVPMFFPLSGVFHARAITRIRDIFGLTSSRFGSNTVRQLIVQPSPLPDVLQERIEATGGFEEKSRRKSSEDEKFYMREYIPGDRLRDINWKSSSRLAQLITRISPHSQEKTRVVQILFRNYSSEPSDSLVSATHLHFIRRWLIAFIRKIRMDHPDYRFHVLLGNGEKKLLESDEDIELFSLDLGALRFMQDPRQASEIPFNEGYLFTTVYDRYLSTFLASHEGVKFHVFRTTFPDGKGEEDSVPIRLLPVNGVVPIPDIWSVVSGLGRKKPDCSGIPRVALSELALRIRLM